MNFSTLVRANVSATDMHKAAAAIGVKFQYPRSGQCLCNLARMCERGWVFLRFCRNKPSLANLSASVFAFRLLRVYTKREIFANRFLSKNRGDLREVLLCWRCIYVVLRGVFVDVSMTSSTVRGDLRKEPREWLFRCHKEVSRHRISHLVP